MRIYSLVFCRTLILGTLFALVAGCTASFSSGGLPSVTYDQIVPHDPKPVVGYTEIFAEVGAKSLYAESHGRHGTMFDIFHEEIEYVLHKSRLFSEINSGKETGEYHFNFILRRQGEYDHYSDVIKESSALPGYAEFITGFTLGLIPTYRDVAKYHLSVEVKRADQLFKQYEYKQNMVRWFQFPFLLLVASSHKPDRIQKEIIDNMLLVFLHDFENDRISMK